MSYQRFKLPETASRAATAATLATLCAYPGQTVASVASVAGGKNETVILGRLHACPNPARSMTLINDKLLRRRATVTKAEGTAARASQAMLQAKRKEIGCHLGKLRRQNLKFSGFSADC